ncbi:hypothetical protein DMC25_12940 [Caulobacter sp. D4A]|uniref:hypothetical protein n=1 Tax=unclassified Caulobacter TaxID=2648921 RepID=UPI000D738DDD|nr:MULTISPECIES: hypothetical protein [unclassified Caulobacter]PXA87087.1 hypothetical protein DMC25_12940 [Caulobacter sp. D4A]PXA95906.1 hypothetical protein DMC18_03010 [Caulobacter sp. D5]
MAETPDEAVRFTGADLIKLFAATYLPLCERLEASGVIDRARLADVMSLYVRPGEDSPSAATVEALQIVLRRARVAADARGRPALRLIPGGRG